MEIKRGSTAKANRCSDKRCQRSASIRNFYHTGLAVASVWIAMPSTKAPAPIKSMKPAQASATR
jgi:hypothetical protein